MNNSTYHVKISQIMTYGFKVVNGLKQRDGLEPCFFDVEVKVKFTLQQATKAQRWSRGIPLLFL